jgi:exodeoxyribonuclease VII small subunit
MTLPKGLKFAEAVGRLESIVEQLEHEEVPLEESFKLFEEGVELARFCSTKLSEAEKKFDKLSKDGLGQLETTPGESIDER